VFSNTAFDTVGTGEDAGLCDFAVCELENDFVGMLSDCCQTLAEFDVLEGDEAGHDFE
jgi:hypothetical protein